MSMQAEKDSKTQVDINSNDIIWLKDQTKTIRDYMEKLDNRLYQMTVAISAGALSLVVTLLTILLTR